MQQCKRKTENFKNVKFHSDLIHWLDQAENQLYQPIVQEADAVKSQLHNGLWKAKEQSAKV